MTRPASSSSADADALVDRREHAGVDQEHAPLQSRPHPERRRRRVPDHQPLGVPELQQRRERRVERGLVGRGVAAVPQRPVAGEQRPLVDAEDLRRVADERDVDVGQVRRLATRLAVGDRAPWSSAPRRRPRPRRLRDGTTARRVWRAPAARETGRTAALRRAPGYSTDRGSRGAGERRSAGMHEHRALHIDGDGQLAQPRCRTRPAAAKASRYSMQPRW